MSARSEYLKGWRSGQNPSAAAIERADARRAHAHWYLGFFDAEGGHDQFHSTPEHV